MKFLLFAAVGLLSFANGANDNFKGVATIWGAGRTTYGRALAWATAFTFLGSLTAVWLAAGLVAKFNGSKLVSQDIYTQLPFLAATALAAAGTVLLAARLGLPISTTHALTGALVGTAVAAAGFGKVQFGSLGSGVVMPLLLSPAVSLGLTLGFYPMVAKLARGRDCVCADEPAVVPAEALGPIAVATTVALPSLRWGNAAECNTGAEAMKLSLSDGLHWISGIAISFARGLNDTPKIAALLLVAGTAAVKLDYALVALAMTLGGLLGAARVATTLSKKITPMATEEAVTANLVAAGLVGLASFFALPVSTTHVTSGGIFGIGLMRRGEADWKRVQEILLSWAATLPLGALLGALFYMLLS